MRIGIIGIGRFGYQLSEQLSENGVDILAIDKHEKAIDLVKDKVAQSFVLHDIDAKALRAMGVDELNTVVITIGKNFADTMLLTYILKKELDVSNVIVRSTSGLKREILEHAGADRVILPEYEAATKLADDLSSPFPNLQRIKDDYCFGNLLAPEKFFDKTIEELDFLNTHKVNCIGVIREGDMLLPKESLTILEGDELYFAGNDRELDALTTLK